MIERDYHLIADAAKLIGCQVVDLIHLGAVGKLNIWTKVTSDVSGLCISREKAGRRISHGKIPVELLPKGPGLALLTKTFLSSLEGNNPGDVQVYLGTENEYLAVMPLEVHNEWFFVLTSDINRLRSAQDAHQKESGKDRDKRIAGRANELKESGTKSFIKTLVAEEGVSESAIKQAISRHKKHNGVAGGGASRLSLSGQLKAANK